MPAFFIGKNILNSFCKLVQRMEPVNRSKQEFFTLDTRITIQRGNIYHNRIKYNADEGMDRFIAFGAIVLITSYLIYLMAEKNEYGWSFQILLMLMWLWPHLRRIYQTLFIKTWKSIIPLKDVKNISTKPLDNGLETEVVLHLQNGRKRFYTFRNAEGQIEPFINMVTAHASIPSPVAIL